MMEEFSERGIVENVVERVIYFLDNPIEILDFCDTWQYEAHCLIDNIGDDRPSGIFRDDTRILIAWCDYNHISGVSCLWDLYRQLGARYHPDGPYGIDQPDDVINDTKSQVSYAIERIEDAAVIAHRLSNKGSPEIRDSLHKAIKKLGKEAKADNIIKEAKVNNRKGRSELRILQREGEYSGFQRDTPGRYKKQ